MRRGSCSGAARLECGASSLLQQWRCRCVRWRSWPRAGMMLHSGAPPITSVFDTTRNVAGTTVFSNNNLTATVGASATQSSAAYTTLFHPNGKFIFRMTENACTPPVHDSCGVGLGSAASSSAANYYVGADATSVGIFDDGKIFINGVNITTLGVTFAPGDTIDVAVDIDGQTIRYSVNGGAFTSAVSIPGLTSYNLSPAVSLNAPTDAFTYSGTTVGTLAGYAVWNSPTPPPPPQTISGISLSNSTFQSALANAAVGTVTVTMSPSNPAFSGTLSLTGANSGGFHLAGTALQASASGNRGRHLRGHQHRRYAGRDLEFPSADIANLGGQRWRGSPRQYSAARKLGD